MSEDDVVPPKRKSLRNSVLKKSSRNSDHNARPYGDDFECDMNPPSGGFFEGFGPMFGMDKEEFLPFGFGGFGNMDRFGDHFNEMMSRFFSDFHPESFADSQYYNQDRDLDDEVSQRGLDKALEGKRQFQQPQSFFGGFSHSESVITRPDGTIEKRVTHKDSEGNIETTVTVTHPDGTKEKLTGEDSQSPRRDIMQDNLVSDFDNRFPSQENDKGLFNRIFDNWKRFF